LGAVGNWDLIGKVITNTFLASAAGGISTMIYTQFRYGLIDITMVINGILAGLVSITAGCNIVDASSAIIIGLVAGVLVDVAVQVIDKMKIDDPVGAIAVHGVNGFFGAIAVGLFASEEGLLFSGDSALFLVQLKGVLVIALFSFIFTYLVMYLMKKTIGVRIPVEEERVGIDAASFGLESYSNFE
jgi:Amt family ammonium transporter